MPGRKTKEDYIEELKIKNPTIELIGDYINARTKTLHHCIVHDIFWDAVPDKVLQGRGCKLCGEERYRNKRAKPIEQYIEELKIKNPGLTLIGEYKNEKTPIEHYCNVHNISFDISPDNALKGKGCKYCKSDKISLTIKKTEEQYIKELAAKNPNLQLVGEYTGTNTLTKHKCLIHNFLWDAQPANILYGCGCPICKSSKGEKEVKSWLDNKNISYIPQKTFIDCCDKKMLPFDFYLNDLNVCIEYQGRQHYESIDYFGGDESLQYTQYHDEFKKEYCIKNNIKLICIPYWENVDQYLNENLLI